MSAFTQGFNHGFMHGMFNNMLGNAWYNPIRNPFVCAGCNPFLPPFYSFYNSGCCCNSSVFWNPASMFMTPKYNFNSFELYPDTNMSMSTYLNVNIPNFITAPSWDSINYVRYDFSNQQTALGDTFVKTTKVGATDKSIDTSSETPSSTKTSNQKSDAKIKHWTEMTDAEMREVYGGYSKDATVLYEGTAEDLNKYLKGKGKLEGMGDAFIKAQNKYGISAAILVGIAMNESAGGTSRLAREQNNIGGVRISGSTKFRSFSSVESCIDNMASFLSKNYINNPSRPLKKLYQINAKYCPASDPTDKTGGNSKWARAVDKFSTEVESALA
jgi:beta-N-acetylglucosaminidase